VCAHSSSSFFFVSFIIELIAGRSEHANESGKKRKRANQGKNGSFLLDVNNF
jgi:hypothetical protein